jgi:DHA1 family tetracycline resistance protein-like MFS transporter
VSEGASESAVEAPQESSPVRSGAVAFIFVTILLDMFALGLILPILPKLVESFVDNDTASAARIFGLFGTAWALMQFLFSPILGGLSDRFGRRPVVLLSNFGLALDYVLMALAPSLTWLFIGRVISGITSASVSTAFAYIADVTPPERRAAMFGKIGVAFGAGFILGPAIGGLLGGMDPRLPFWVAAGLSFANALYGFFPNRCRPNAARRSAGKAQTRSVRCICCAPTVFSQGCRWQTSWPSLRMWCCRACSSSMRPIAMAGIRPRLA